MKSQENDFLPDRLDLDAFFDDAETVSPVRKKVTEPATVSVNPHSTPAPGNSPKHKFLDARAIKEQVGNRWLDLLRDLVPELHDALKNRRQHVPCPMHGGGDGFKLFKDADVTGGAACNTCGFFPDGLGLLRAIRGWSFPETLRQVAQWLDDHMDDKGAAMKLSDHQTQPDEKITALIEATMEQGVRNHPLLTSYFQSRGLRIFPPNTLMLSENEMYYDESVGMTYHPAMIGVFLSPTGETVCLSRTYLADDGNGKASVPTPKKFSRAVHQGAMRRAAIRLYNPGAILGIAEGIETAAAVFEATGTPMWATGSANGMVSLQIPKEVKRVEIWADNDSSGVGQQSAMKLARRLYCEGFAVSVMIPILPDTDWLDVYVEEGEDALWEAIGFFPVCNPSAPEIQKLENAAAKTKAPETAGGYA